MTSDFGDHAPVLFPVLVTAKERLADGVAALILRRTDGSPFPSWRPGAHADLHLAPGLVRQYSLCGDPEDADRWRLAILREDAGRGGSRYVHDELTVGQELSASAPRNHFPLEEAEEYLFIAGGIGITPILPMVAAAAAAGARWRLVYGGRRRSSMAFLDELDRHGSAVEVRPEDEYGLLDLPDLLDVPRAGTAVYCCGPEGLLRAVEERCAHWPSGTLHIERFSPVEVDTSADAAFEVELAQSGLVLRVEAGESLLDAVEAAGIAIVSSCREGTCGTCETPVLEGVPEHRDGVLSEAERSRATTMMICVSRSRTDRLVLDL